MTDKQTLLDLADKVEGLDKPCRETDWKVGVVSGQMQEIDAVYAASGDIMNSSKRYTASIDAAFSLVPDGWHIAFSTFYKRTMLTPDDGESYCVNDPKRVEGHAKSARLSIVAAALRARAAECES